MVEVTRVQTGVRIEESLLKVLKGLAEYATLGLGDLIEGICLHAFEGKNPFTPETRRQIERLKQIYSLRLTAEDSHRLTESLAPRGSLRHSSRRRPK